MALQLEERLLDLGIRHQRQQCHRIARLGVRCDFNPIFRWSEVWEVFHSSNLSLGYDAFRSGISMSVLPCQSACGKVRFAQNLWWFVVVVLAVAVFWLVEVTGTTVGLAGLG